MSARFNRIAAEILSAHLDTSEIYDSGSYNELEKRIAQCAEALYDKVDESLFSDYREARIDLENLFYKFGFLDGLKFFHTLTSAPPDEIINACKEIEPNLE